LLVNNYAAWSGDRIVQFVQNAPNSPTGTGDAKQLRFRFILYPALDTISQLATPDSRNIAHATGFPYDGSGINFVPPIAQTLSYPPAANRVTSGMLPIIQSDSEKNRIVIPFHCPNRFVVTPFTTTDHGVAPLPDQWSQGLLCAAWDLNAVTTETVAVQVMFQYGDGFRMSHYRPQTYTLTGIQVAPGFAYVNYFGQFFQQIS